MKSTEGVDNRRILLVDDNHSIHQDFQKILGVTVGENALNQARSALFAEASNCVEPEHFELDCVDQGQHALAEVQMALKAGRPYAVAFVDMRMPPGWDGLETIERLWKEDPAMQIVICTAYSDQPWDEIRRRIGRNDKLLILQKPFTSIQVLQLAAALSRKWNLACKVEGQLKELNTLVDARTTELQRTNDQLMQVNQALVRTVADLESAQAKISQQNAELERLASRDSLTGCLNRRAVYAQLETAFARNVERGAELCCLMVDIDHFKRINDRFGHTMGDHAIQAVAVCLSNAIRLTDLLGRYGGEEFCLVFPDTELAEAAELAERLRIRVEAEAGDRVRTAFSMIITVSCGVSSTRCGATTPLELIDQADKALYAAKEAGRNCVMALDPIVDQRHMAELIEPQVKRITPRHPVQAIPR
jgi:diguanylate cyclase (GGDEF)-like protein